MPPNSPRPADRVQLRSMVPGDIPFVVERMVAEGWAATPARIQVHLAHDPHGCFVAELDTRPAGLVTTTRFRDSAWIGNLITSPEARRRGIGTRLIRHCLARLTAAGVRTVRLEADPMGEGIYRREGFVDECISRRYWSAGGRGRQHDAVRPLAAVELEGLAAFDATGFGDDRGPLLRLLHDQAAACLALGPPGAWRGYLLVVPTQSGTQLGPCVAVDARAARILVEAALTHARGAVVLGVPEPNGPALALFEDLDFVANPSSLRMVYGPPASLGDHHRVFALASGACG